MPSSPFALFSFSQPVIFRLQAFFLGAKIVSTIFSTYQLFATETTLPLPTSLPVNVEVPTQTYPVYFVPTPCSFYVPTTSIQSATAATLVVVFGVISAGLGICRGYGWQRGRLWTIMAGLATAAILKRFPLEYQFVAHPDLKRVLINHPFNLTAWFLAFSVRGLRFYAAKACWSTLVAAFSHVGWIVFVQATRNLFTWRHYMPRIALNLLDHAYVTHLLPLSVMLCLPALRPLWWILYQYSADCIWGPPTIERFNEILLCILHRREVYFGWSPAVSNALLTSGLLVTLRVVLLAVQLLVHTAEAVYLVDDLPRFILGGLSNGFLIYSLSMAETSKYNLNILQLVRNKDVSFWDVEKHMFLVIMEEMKRFRSKQHEDLVALRQTVSQVAMESYGLWMRLGLTHLIVTITPVVVLFIYHDLIPFTRHLKWKYRVWRRRRHQQVIE
ncbi:hypothetical protein MIND_00675200 [Mycena indigotica]|uniref:Uncharacterized protein n=1 Tax=Mycena indigotica TaxID=2126181 RepID=A0A8H6W135_9AGAR|nr:uncharacterized protein MIND_00675200 [Mycena indigotica]KAF7301112.1 hypothetical protein MIND_00675200 [Mycena indigotica]